MANDVLNLPYSRLVYAPQVTLEAAPMLLTETPLSARADQGKGTVPEQIIERAGRECYDSFGRGRSSEDFHAHLREVKHGSVLRHVNFTWRISGVSRGLTHELVRHAAGVGISQRSTRYVDEQNCRLVVPPEMIVKEADTEAARKLKRQAQHRLLMAHDRAREDYAQIYQDMRQLGLGNKAARGAARAALLTNTETSLYWTANAQALTTILAQRWSEAADAEIRRLAGILLDHVRRFLPTYFSPVDGAIERL